MLGQGDELAQFLESHALMHDSPFPWIWLTDISHPPTELRIDRLTRYDETETSPSPRGTRRSHRQATPPATGGNGPDGVSKARTNPAGNTPNPVGGLDSRRPARS